MAIPAQHPAGIANFHSAEDRSTMAMEWTISIEGKSEFGDICRREVRIDKSEERLRDGDLGLSIGDGKKIMAALQNAVVSLGTLMAQSTLTNRGRDYPREVTGLASGARSIHVFLRLDRGMRSYHLR
ncbi:hypothetical protein NKJ36_33175 [Mesorhizobium sp. M0142]|uniref:hypothetical protein n=1 Tax=Mesorhizobium sp. M0142 TaxID=2956894 RepID=UPI003337D841